MHVTLSHRVGNGIWEFEVYIDSGFCHSQVSCPRWEVLNISALSGLWLWDVWYPRAIQDGRRGKWGVGRLRTFDSYVL